MEKEQQFTKKIEELEQALLQIKEQVNTCNSSFEDNVVSHQKKLSKGNPLIEQSNLMDLEVLNLGYKQKISEINDYASSIQSAISKSAILILDSHGFIKYYTDACLEFFNLKEVDIGRSLLDINHSLLEINISEIVEQSLLDDINAEFELETKQKKAVLLRVTTNYSFLNENKDITLSIVDVTKAKRCSEAILKQHDALNLALKNSEIGVWTWNVSENKIEFDTTVSSMFDLKKGCAPKSFLDFEQHIHPEDQKMVEQSINESLSTGVALNIEYRILLENKLVRHILTQGKVVKDCIYGHTKLSGICWDITDRSRKENELFSHAEKEIILDDVSDGWWYWDFVSGEKFMSPKFKATLGYQDHELSNSILGWRSIIHQDDLKILINQFERHLGDPTQNVLSQEIRFLHKNGSIVWIICRGKLSQCIEKKPSKLIGTATDITHLKQSENNLKQQANYDDLTKLNNRGVFLASLPRAMARAKRNKNRMYVFFIDLDGFKQVNDNFGHDVGDSLLLKVSENLLALSRTTDLVARLGGDEFGILVEDIQYPQDVILMAKRYINAFKRALYIADHQIEVSLSIGISSYPCHGDCPHELLKSADKAMYRAKESGKGNYVFYDDEINQVVKRKNSIENQLQNAIKKNELSLVYQPQISLDDGKVTGLETLIRWQSKALGNVEPEEFIPVAEQSNLIKPIGNWVIRKAFQEYSKIIDNLKDSNIKLALNISLEQLADKDFEEYLKSALDDASISPNNLIIELTEATLVSYMSRPITHIHKIAASGVGFAIDNFGIGAASLKHIQDFPITKIKIDKSVVREIPANKISLNMVKGLILLADSFNIKVIAEGVETQEQYDFIKRENCYGAQGYYLGEPLSFHELVQSRLVN